MTNPKAQWPFPPGMEPVNIDPAEVEKEVTALEEQQKLIQVLKFTPRTYNITMWGYGGETVMGTVDRKIYDYFKRRRLSVSEFAWDSGYAEENNIPEEMYPFEPGCWHDCDNLAHAWGVSMSSGTIQITDEKGDTVYERSLEDCDGFDNSPELSCGDEVWIDGSQPGTVVFIGRSSEKGTFFEGEINLQAPFDISKLSLGFDDIDGDEIVNYVSYDNEDIDNYGGSTDGKSSDFGFYIAGTLKDGKWERYRDLDDIEYTLTDWFPKKIKPVREGMYMVRTPGKNSYTYQAKWNGKIWTSSYNDVEIKIKEWAGITYNPDDGIESEGGETD